ncbi:M48 family metallopeptidase [Piscinibacter sp. XHJ-5]|uniref:M48 family metallopeptidase n=1 Tax=Piscinibacter sp. XHJ-5 TaxID=3037797 RepID=UPI00245284EC|nr:M48 family metallopeptidase [Piscinibacter sp. XHJ-5]
MGESAGPLVAADYFDGRSARAHPVRLQAAGDRLLIDGPTVSRSVALHEVRWPERTRHGPRVAHLADGASLHCSDSAAWDAWRHAVGSRESLVVRAQQSWRWTLASMVLIVLLLAAGYLWGVPWAARAALTMLPTEVDESVGETALAAIDERLMRPSELPLAQQQRIAGAFARAVAALPAHEVPVHRIVFRKSRIGPNAFALPGGTLVLTDELVKRVSADEAILVGVLGHELGHLRHRHGMRALAQVAALGTVAGLVVGDFSSLLASVPVWLGQAGYSRDAEREADAEAVRVLRAAGFSPAVMVAFFEAMARHDDGGARERSGLEIAIASHPADAERMRFFRDAGAAR